MEEVKVWLCENGFGDYGQNFEDNGWDDLTLLPDMTYAQMKKCIHKEGHVAKFRKAARQLKKDSNAGINDNRKLNTRPGKRTTEYPTEYRQPVASSPGSSLGDRLLSKFRKAARQLKKDSNAGINDNRKLNTRAGKRTTECPTENIQPDATSPGSSLGDSLLSNDATAKYSQGIEKPRKLNTLTKEGTEHEDGGNFDAGIINAASSCVYSSTPNENFSSDEFSTSSIEGCSLPVTVKADNELDTSELAGEGKLTASMPDQDPVNFTYIAHSDHTTVNKAVTQIIPEYCSSTSANENHKDQMETVADWYEKPNKLYVETNAFRESKNILENQYWVTIIGKPGDGKSMMAAHLMSQYRHKGFEPVFITSVQDWKNLITGDRVKQFVVIDDLFGTTCLDRVKLKEWEAYIGIIEKLVSKRKGNLLVVSTSRKYIFEDAKTSLAKFELFRNFKLLDLTSDSWKLTIKEKEEIFEKYAVKYKIEDYSRQDVGQLDTPHGYPHCVAMFCTNIFFRKAGLTFFKNPAQCIQKEIHNFRVNDRIKYLVLLLGLKTELKEHAIETLCYEPTETTKHLFKAAGVSLDTALPDICIALYSLTNTYLRKGVDGCFYFTHESLLENVAAVFMSVSPILAIKTVDFRLLFMKKYTGTSVLSFNAHTSDHSVSAHEEVLRQMIRRITTELFQRNVFHVIMCDVWNDQKFVNHWVKYVSTMKADKLVELFCPKTNVFGNLFTTFIQLNKGYVLKTVLDNRFLCGKIDLLHLLQECLEVGCSENCSSNLVKAIVTHPVASPNKLNGSKLLMEALEKSNFICAKLLLENTVIDQKYVDNFERGYFHRLVRTQVKLEDIDIFETILKALLNICDDINTKDCLDESPMDFFINNVDKMLIADEKGSAYFICACLARNDFKPLNKISTYLHSYISQKIQSRSMSDSQTFENIIKDVFNDFPDLLEYIFYYPYPAAVAFMDHHHVGLFEALNLYTFQSLFNEIIRHQKLEHVFITSLKHKSVHMKSSSSWAKFLQRGLERVCFETFSYLKRIKTLATVLSGDIKAETIELFCSKINELGKSFTTFIQLNKGCVVQSILDKLALPGLLQECLEIACAVICSTELVKTIVLHPIASSNRLEGSESLMKALEKSNFTCANLLIDNTAIDQQYVDNFERGYLHRLVRAQIKCGDLDIFETVLKAILDIGCDINTKDSFGDSPLDYMIIDGKYESAFRICSCLMRKRFIPMKQRIYTLTFPKYYKEGHGVKLKLLKR